MKRNLSLFGLLVALIIATYFFQEKKMERDFFASFTKDHLINPEQITKLEFSGITAVKKDGQWWSGDKLLSHNIFRQLERKISQIKKIKAVDGDEKNYFSDKVEFKVNDETWAIGDPTLDQQGFYLARGKDIMVVMVDGENGELTDDETKLAQMKLDDLKKGLTMPPSQLGETQLFRYFPNLPLGTVTVDTDGRPSYELDLKNNKTIPAPIPGISVHNHLINKFRSIVTQMTIKQEVPYDEKLKFSKISQMVFSDGEKKVNWELWLKGDNSADSYILDNTNKRAWLMVGGTLKAFFIQAQDYWDKKVIPPSEFENFSRLDVTLTQGDKSAEIEVVNREPLAFETDKYQVNMEKMNILFQYVFNLSEKDQADRVSLLSKSERKEVLSGDHLKMEVFGQDLVFWRKPQELIVVNLTQGFKAHFLMADESFRATFEDVLKLRP